MAGKAQTLFFCAWLRLLVTLAEMLGAPGLAMCGAGYGLSPCSRQSITLSILKLSPAAPGSADHLPSVARSA